MKRLLTILPVILCLIGCQSDGETSNKIAYEKNYEFVIDMPGVAQNTIYDSIPIWLNSELPEKDINSNDAAKNFAQTFMALNSPSWADSSIQNKKRNMKNVTTDNKDAGIFACSIKNVVIETQNEAWGAGGLWLVANADIMVQVKNDKYRVLWENVVINQIEISGNGRNSWVRPKTVLKEKTYEKLIATLENASHNLKNYVEKINNNDW